MNTPLNMSKESSVKAGNIMTYLKVFICQNNKVIEIHHQCIKKHTYGNHF